MKSHHRKNGEMSVRQADRIIEMFENASKNGEEWAHNVFLRRGTDKYHQTIELLNEAFRVKSINITIVPIEYDGPPLGRRQR